MVSITRFCRRQDNDLMRLLGNAQYSKYSYRVLAADFFIERRYKVGLQYRKVTGKDPESIGRANYLFFYPHV